MKNTAHERVAALLEQSGRPFKLHDHPVVRTIDEAHERVPHLTTNLLKTVVFKIKESDWILAAVLGKSRIDYKKLADALGVNRKTLRPVSPDDVERELGFQVGGVGPFPVQPGVIVIFDEELLELGSVFCGSGLNTRTVEMNIGDLVPATSGRIHSIGKP